MMEASEISNVFLDKYVQIRKSYVKIVGQKAITSNVKELKRLCKQRDKILKSFHKTKSLVMRFHDWYLRFDEDVDLYEPLEVMEIIDYFTEYHCPWTRSESLVLHALATAFGGQTNGQLFGSWMTYVAHIVHMNIVQRAQDRDSIMDFEYKYAEVIFCLFEKVLRCQAGNYTVCLPDHFTLQHALFMLSQQIGIPVQYLFLEPKKMYKSPHRMTIRDQQEYPHAMVKIRFCICVENYEKHSILNASHYLSGT